MLKKLLVLLVMGLTACQDAYVPKPRAYFRISFPQKDYAECRDMKAFEFEKATYAHLEQLAAPEGQEWVNVSTPTNKVDIHLSYETLRKDLDKHLEEARKLAYDHSIKADAIEEQFYANPAQQVYGMVYRIKGNAASPMQFFLTDSAQNFIRGAFYVREVPNVDSIQPVIDFFESDVVHLIETFQWTSKK
ncbi:MAG: gliding motility lipoprotein GldD [Mangrovibacterium sp.]